MQSSPIFSNFQYSAHPTLCPERSDVPCTLSLATSKSNSIRCTRRKSFVSLHTPSNRTPFESFLRGLARYQLFQRLTIPKQFQNTSTLGPAQHCRLLQSKQSSHSWLCNDAEICRNSASPFRATCRLMAVHRGFAVLFNVLGRLTLARQLVGKHV